MSSFYYEIERIIKNRIPEQLDQLLYYYGLEFDIYVERKDHNTSVYGKFANNHSSFFKTIKGLIVEPESYAAMDDVYSGSLSKGTFYTKDNELLVGMILQVRSKDSKIRRYRVTSVKSLGMTTDIMKTFEVESMAA